MLGERFQMSWSVHRSPYPALLTAKLMALKFNLTYKNANRDGIIYNSNNVEQL